MHGYREGLLEAGHYVMGVPSTANSRNVNQNLGGGGLASAVAAGSDVVWGVVLGVRIDGADVRFPSVEERCLHLLRAHVETTQKGCEPLAHSLLDALTRLACYDNAQLQLLTHHG